MSEEDQKIVDELAQNVGNALAGGALQSEVAAELVKNGMEENEARDFVAAVGHAVQSSSGGGVPGWVYWVGGLVGFNVLSYIFDWGWIVY